MGKTLDRASLTVLRTLPRGAATGLPSLARDT